MAKLIYRGLKADLPSSREANSVYFTMDSREIYFGDNLYTDNVRFYRGEKPQFPAQGSIYVNEDTGAGDVWNGTEWKNVILRYADSMESDTGSNTVPTSEAVKEYINNHLIPVATHTIVGGIKSSDSIRIDPDGTAHAVVGIGEENFATDEEVENILNEVYQ